VKDAEHITIFRDPAYFAGWPFNHGCWSFGDGEVLVGFCRGRTDYEAPYDVRHRVVDGQRGEYVVLRSSDGGHTWPVEGLQSLGTHADLERRLLGGGAPSVPDAAADWSAPDFCLTAGFGLPPEGAPDVGYIQFSRDRGRTWLGPYSVPALGFQWVQVKPDYVVRSDGLVLLFVTVARGRGSRFVAVLATPDGGISWHYLSALMASSPDLEFVHRYYACPVLLPDGRILAVLRCQIDARNAWPEVFQSVDGGHSWQFVVRPADWGGPSHLTLLDDGRLLLVYGYRVRPYGIRARVSEDGGRRWGPELVLRQDGGSWDLGYPRTVKLPGGRMLVVYYLNRADDPVWCEGGVRHIAGTIFAP
jgi:hypothetical protein